MRASRNMSPSQKCSKSIKEEQCRALLVWELQFSQLNSMVLYRWSTDLPSQWPTCCCCSWWRCSQISVSAPLVCCTASGHVQVAAISIRCCMSCLPLLMDESSGRHPKISRRPPVSFRELYPRCRAIIDCTKIPVYLSSQPHESALIYSDDKGPHTIKLLNAIAPCGTVTFISKVYGSRPTDSFITSDSGFPSLLEPGDLLISDKGFPWIRTSLANSRVTLLMPPLVHSNAQFTADEVDET